MGCLKLTYQEGEGLEKSTVFLRGSLEKKRQSLKKCYSYYPFGMQTGDSWTADNTDANNYLFNAGSEQNNTTGNYQTFFRDYDPALGRMNGIDIMAGKYSSISPYNFAFNDPVGLNDPTGAEPYGGGANPGGWSFENGDWYDNRPPQYFESYVTNEYLLNGEHGRSIFWGNDGGQGGAFNRGIKRGLRSKYGGTVSPKTGNFNPFNSDQEAGIAGLRYVNKHNAWYYTKPYKDALRKGRNRVIMAKARKNGAVKVNALATATIRQNMSLGIPTVGLQPIVNFAIDLENNTPWMLVANSFLGVSEIAGDEHNETIVGFFDYTTFEGIDGLGATDEDAWCAAFGNFCFGQSGIPGTNSALARSFLNWGYNIASPQVGAAAIFWTGDYNDGASGHFGFIHSINADGSLEILGGNQGNSVSISTYSIDKILGYRMPNGY